MHFVIVTVVVFVNFFLFLAAKNGKPRSTNELVLPAKKKKTTKKLDNTLVNGKDLTMHGMDMCIGGYATCLHNSAAHNLILVCEMKFQIVVALKIMN